LGQLLGSNSAQQLYDQYLISLQNGIGGELKIFLKVAQQL
jgi:hypothetical protein